MNSVHVHELQEILLRYPFQFLVVPCPCRSGSPYPAVSDCSYCIRTWKIMYGIAEVEVV